MRKSIACLGLSILFGISHGTADAQVRSEDRYSFNNSRVIRRESARATNNLFVQDAMQKAEQRRARMKIRKERKQSTLRPTVSYEFPVININPYYAVPAWYMYSQPVWWSMFHRGY